MRVFVSWSGNRSRALAQALTDWLPRALPVVEKAWMSPAIPTGTDWRAEIMRELRAADAAIACLTPENLRSQWLNFETGAAATISPEQYRLFPVSLTNDPVPGPLAGLQTAHCTEDGMRTLVKSLNAICKPRLTDAWIDAQVALLWKDLSKHLDDAKRLLPDTSWEDYEDAIRNIDEHLRELERTRRVSVITFYVRDYAAPKEAIDFYIEALHGLNDRAPMFGPIVFDDERKRELSKPESFGHNTRSEVKKAAASAIEGRAMSFVGRERIAAYATFRDLDSDGAARALLNLNWRSEQSFTEARRQQLREDAAAVFRLLPRRPSISLDRSRLLTKELRARRYLGATEPEAARGDRRSKIRGALAQFFAPDDSIEIEIVSLEKNRAMKWSRNGTNGKSCPIAPDWKWVQGTTKPLFLKPTADRATIIVPMRIPPRLNTCRGLIVVSGAAGALKPDMVRPLCSLGDTFGGMSRSGV